MTTLGLSFVTPEVTRRAGAPQAALADNDPLLPAVGAAEGLGSAAPAAGQLFQTWNSETCPAGHPVLAVKFSCTYR
jgi:hypothetical protein